MALDAFGIAGEAAPLMAVVVPNAMPQVQALMSDPSYGKQSARQNDEAQDVARNGAPTKGARSFPGGFGAGTFDQDKQASAIITNPLGRLLGWLIDYANPAEETPWVADEAGGFVFASGEKFAGQQRDELRPRIGVFRRKPSTFVRLLDFHKPPVAAAQVARSGNMGPGGQYGNRRTPAQPIFGNRTVRWPKTIATYLPVSGKEPDA